MTLHAKPDPAAATVCEGPADLPVMDEWRIAGRELVARHSGELDGLIDTVERLVATGDFAHAAAAAQVAANHAVMWHSGRFASHRLEAAIRRLGHSALPGIGTRRPRMRQSTGMNVLHVASRVAGIGGGSRMIWRWIGRDRANRHSLALTRQIDAVPARLRDAVAESGGRIARINFSLGGLLGWARRLQAALAEADIVVLHADNFDIVPVLALAGMERRPPVLLLNHSDHVLWLGAGFADLVVNTRRSGLELCVARRGIPRERNALMPLCLEPMPRTLSRVEAKRILGLPEDSVVLLTIARAVKYRALGGASFADTLVPVLRDDPRVHLVAVGPGGAVDWSAAMAAVPGRIHLHPERPDTATFFQAADIYIDSFPFPSITSLFEAGLFGLPLVSFYPFGPGCEVMGADSPGIDGVLVRCESASAYRAELNRLLAAPSRRVAVGERTRANIEATNIGEGWLRALEAVYDRALALPPRAPGAGCDTPRLTDLDAFLPFVFGHLDHGQTPEVRMACATEADLRLFPIAVRLQTWLGLARRRGFVFRKTSQAWRYLLPEWLTGRLKGLSRTWR
ncbi:glycosyltransferase [Paracoccus sp. S-4012]|uniref:glycosyltransferase n=1 Tax=Paracoccus sp. S-4012 TaxID=2665648 RepID=UPI0018A22250|nr:glycosyltransferase [Paracoccus sp. S-4012]